MKTLRGPRGPYKNTRKLTPPNPSGICQCGTCGLTTSLATMTDAGRGKIAGEHVRYIRGHQDKGKRRPLQSRVKHLVPPNPSGLCWCGCKGMTKRARQSDVTRGWLKGEFVQYIHNHHSKIEIEYVVEDRGYLSHCWIWQLTIDVYGYGHATHEGKGMGAHRSYYMRHKGPIPEGFHVDHLCYVRSCVNPDHLEAVTPQINDWRKWQRIRQAARAKRLAEPLFAS